MSKRYSEAALRMTVNTMAKEKQQKEKYYAYLFNRE
jgi:hypothetical protein